MSSSNNGVDVGYNVQATVDGKHNLVADMEVIENAADSGQLFKMASRAKKVLGVEEIKVLADRDTVKTIRILSIARITE